MRLLDYPLLFHNVPSGLKQNKEAKKSSWSIFPQWRRAMHLSQKWDAREASRAGSEKKEKAEAMMQRGKKDVGKNEDGKEGKKRR